MRTPTLLRRPCAARAAFVAAAGTGPSSVSANPLAHLVRTPIHDQK